MRLKCCVCRNDDTEEFYGVINGYELMKCRACRLVFLKDVPTRVLELDFIQEAKIALSQTGKERVEYFSFPHLYRKYKNVFDGYFRQRLCRIRRHFPELKSMLDIGCGYGLWMKYCHDRGIEVDGIDMSEEVIKWMAANFSLKGKVVKLEDFETREKHDCIVLCDILEHIADPNSQIQKLKGMLNENGLMYIQVPSVIGFKLPRGQGHELPFHLWQFSYRALKKLFEKNGFLVLNWWTGVTGLIGVYEKNNGKVPFLKRLEWKVAHSFKIGNRLQILVRKNNAAWRD